MKTQTQQEMPNPFGFTKEELLELTSNKLLDQMADESDVYDRYITKMSERIEKVYTEKIETKIDEFIDAEMNKVINKVIQPVDMWGEEQGEITTLKEQLVDKATKYWTQKVDREGKPSRDGWGNNETMASYLIGKIAKDEFSRAVKNHMDVIVKALRETMSKSAKDDIDNYFNKLEKTIARS